MNGVIQIQQTLHGYRQGHQLLDSSEEFSFVDRRVLDMMSDGEGIDSTCNDGYITGYMLPESRKYVVAKTWYAGEMERPGCVWTHSLLIDLEDFAVITDPEEILALFRRPGKEHLINYAEPILVRQEDKLNLLNTDKLQYVVYTIYGADAARYVEVEDGRYGAYLLLAVSRMPVQLLENFSFCTNSQVNRYMGGIPFSYQMVLPGNVYKVYHESAGGRLYQEKGNHVSCPAWAREYARAVISHDTGEIDGFLGIFDGINLQFTTFNQLLRLYFITRDWDAQYSFGNYVDIAQKLFKENFEACFEKMVKEYIDGRCYDELFLEDFMEMTNIAKKLKKKITEIDQDRLADKLIHKAPKNISEFLGKYIHGELGREESSLAQKIMLSAKAEDLKAISKMEHDVVVVAVATNYKLIFSKDIWEQPRFYQCDVINAMDADIPYDDWVSVLTLIMEHGGEDVSEAVYNKAQSNLVPVLLELFRKEMVTRHSEMLYIWDRYLLEDQVNLVRCLKSFTSQGLIKHLLLKINTYDSDVRNAIPVSEWNQLFQSCRFENRNDQMVIAIKMLPVILGGGPGLSEEFVAPVFGRVHQGLEDSQITFEDWLLFERYLPSVDKCYAWDKCLRLRMAFMNEGYDIERLLRVFQGTYWSRGF